MDDLNNYHKKYCGIYIVEHISNKGLLPVESYSLRIDGFARWDVIDIGEDAINDMDYKGSWTADNSTLTIIFEKVGSSLIEDYIRKGEFFEDAEVEGRYLRRLPQHISH